MPRPKAKAPALRYHISGKSVVTLNGRDFYLGMHDRPETLAKYAVLIKHYQENGLMLPDDFDIDAMGGDVQSILQTNLAATPSNQEAEPNLVRHITANYREHAKSVYATSKSELARILQVCDELDTHTGDTLASAFGPRLLREQRKRWVESGKARNYCNRLTNLVVRMFRYAVSEELVEDSAWNRLKSIEPLKEGQTTAPETQRVKPVSLADVRATSKELPPVIRAMLRVHVATGMRPSELCSMRPSEIDRTGDVWIYRPSQHKNKRKGKARAIPILGDAREAITDYLNRAPASFCFSPLECVAWQNAQKRASRQTKVQPSQVSRAKENPQTQAGDRYTQDSYRRAIARACKRAKVQQWHPYQLRHLNLTEIRDVLGVEFAQAMGGHSRVDMTEVYAMLSERKAIEAARHAPQLGE